MIATIRSHPIVSFFIMACGLSWTSWLGYILCNTGLGLIDEDFPVVLGTTQIVGMLPGAYLGPIGSALIITAILDGRAGLTAWRRRLFRLRAKARWYVVALLAVPTGLILLGLVFSGGRITAPPIELLVAYVPMLVLQLLTTGLAEEPGWRDFALHRLQQRMSPLAAAAVLGPVWAVWHWPLFLTEWADGPGRSLTGLLAFTVFCIAFNVVMSWVFNSTDQSLPLSMFMHVSLNTFSSAMFAALFPTVPAGHMVPIFAVGAVIAATIIIIATRGRLGLKEQPIPPSDDEPAAPAELPASVHSRA
jgi:membrane protease YdiL (CAAX protease family)